MAGLADYCTKKNYITSNFYSNVYRTTVELDGETAVRDVVHISLPFSKEKEDALKIRYGLSDIELLKYYKTFANNLKHAWKAEDFIQKSNNSNADMASLYRKKVTVLKAEGQQGSDIFIVREPSEALTAGRIMSRDGITLHSLFNLGIRLLQTVKTYSKCGVSIGYFDIDSMYTVTDGAGRQLIKTGYFGMSRFEDCMPTFTPESEAYLPDVVLDGTEELSFDSDLYSVCSLLWTMLDGRHYSVGPDLERQPEYAPPELTQALEAVMENGEIALKNLDNTLRSCIKKYPDSYIHFSTPPEGYPEYEPEEHIGDRLARECAASDDDFNYDAYENGDTEEREPESKGMKVATAALILGAVLYLALIALPKFIPGNESLPETKHSSEDGFYLYNGEIVDGDGLPCSGFRTDSEGNVYSVILEEDENGEEKVASADLAYRYDFTDPFIPISEIRTEIVSSEYITLPTLEDYGYREEVFIPADGTVDRNITDGTLGIDENIIEEENITEGTVVLLNEGDSLIPFMLGEQTEREKFGTGEEWIYFRLIENPPETYVYNASKEQIEEARINETVKEQAGEAWLGGTGIYRIRAEVLPENRTCDCIIFEIEYPVTLVDTEGVELKTGERIELNEENEFIFEARSNTKGKFSIIVSDPGGYYKKEIKLEFTEGRREIDPEPEELPKTSPSPVPTPLPSSSPTPSPSPSPTPVSTPTPAPAQTDVNTYTPVPTPSLEPSTIPESTEFKVSAEIVEIKAGETFRIATSGDDGGSIYVFSSDNKTATVTINGNIDGEYTITGVAAGTCVITFRAATGKKIQVNVTVA